MNQTFSSEFEYFRWLDSLLFSELSILPDSDIKLKVIKSVTDRLSKRFGEITKEWVMAELRVLARFHNKKFIFTHIDKRMLLNKVNSLRESFGLNKIEKLDNKELRTYLDKDRNKVYSYFDFNTYEAVRNNILHV